MKDESALREILEREMVSNYIEIVDARKFFYPLAEPTYGVDEVMEAIDSMAKFKTSMWEKVAQFEREFGSKYGGEAIMVNSGSSADLLISFALLEKSGGALKAGDEIIVPAVTWPTHLWSLLMAGFKIKLVDIDPHSLNFSIESIEAAISPNTRAIFVVHLLGNTGNMQDLLRLCAEKKLLLMEDCCEALGSKYQDQYVGTFGIASSFSFFFSHHLITMEGGMILTRDSDFAQRCRVLRAHGWNRRFPLDTTLPASKLESRYEFVNWGFNVRPTELQAGFGLVQLRKMDEFDAQRKQNALVLRKGIERHNKYIFTMEPQNKVELSWFAFPLLIRSESLFSRENLCDFLETHGIETRPIVAGNLARQPAMIGFPEIVFSDLKNADFIHNSGLYIGIHPKKDDEKLFRVLKILDNFFESKSFSG
jgi:CDP-6-deoxy-D-xylo-4-hexulose-3-dehydrase